MSDETSGSSGKKWISGVLASVAAAVLVWVLTTWVPSWFKSSPPSGDGQTLLRDIEVDGVVIDGVSNRVVDGAMVTLTIGPASQQDLTTSFGSYSFLVKGANPSVVARVSVAANGYRNVSDQAVAGDWGIRESVLIPVHIAGSASAGGGGHPPAEGPAAPNREPLRRIDRSRFVRPATSKVLILKK